MAPFVPADNRRGRVRALLAIILVVLVVVVRGRGNGRIPLSVAVKAATNGSFYHWRDFAASHLKAEGWCALRRSRTLDHIDGSEERKSPSGVYRKTKGRATFASRNDVSGMEEGNDFLTKTAARLSGLDSKLTPLGGNRWQDGRAVYILEPRTARILRIEAPGERVFVDYPLALSSDLFERPR